MLDPHWAPQPGTPVQERKNLTTSGKENQHEFCMSVSVRQRSAGHPDTLQWGASSSAHLVFSISGSARNIQGRVELWVFQWGLEGTIVGAQSSPLV